MLLKLRGGEECLLACTFLCPVNRRVVALAIAVCSTGIDEVSKGRCADRESRRKVKGCEDAIVKFEE